MSGIVTLFSIGLLGASTFFLLIAIVVVLWFAHKIRQPNLLDQLPSMTILKPICGLEERLEENLCSFCDQDFPAYQIIFAVQDRRDPAIPIIKKVISKFPDKDLSLTVNERVHGKNLKASNLVNMFEKARHDIIVVADSDVRVKRDYLKSIATPFFNNKVAAATCLYSGAGDRNLASRLGVMFMNDWFLPSALISAFFIDLKYCFGATMAIRRDVLNKIGGFEALTNFLADDYMLGKAVVKQGYKVALVPYIVENIVSEKNLKSLFYHELRWARTIRSVQPKGYTMSFITEAFPISILTGIFIYLYSSSLAWTMLPIITTLTLRITLHFIVQKNLARSAVYTPWLIPARDLFTLGVRIVSLFGRKVRWRDQTMVVCKGGHLSPLFERPSKKTKTIGTQNEKDTASQPTYV